jgi:uncharacterized protein YPO0396
MAHWPWNTDPTLNTVSKQLADLTALVKGNHAKEMESMSKLDDKLDALDAAQAGALARIDEDVKSFEEEIAALKKAIEEGQVLTPTQEERLDAIIAIQNAIDPRKPAVLPE